MLRLLFRLALSCMLISFSSVFTTQAAPKLEDEFDPSAFSPAEVGIIQRSLSFAGYYDGLWDSEWGQYSQRALERYANENFGSGPLVQALVVPLFLGTLESVSELGWAEEYYPAFGVRLGIPTKLMDQQQAAGGSLEFSGAGVAVRVFWENSKRLTGMHRQLAGDGNPSQHYILRRETRWVTSESRNGSVEYLRSEWVQGRWVSLSVRGSTPHQDIVRYITNSFVAAPGYEVNPNTMVNLTSLLDQARGRPDHTSTKTQKGATPNNGQVTGSGSGFFITTNLVVTNNHVVEKCRYLSNPANGSFDVVAIDTDLDLALLRFSGYSQSYLSLSPDLTVNLGQPVYALGYPYYGMINTSLNFTSGVASAINGFGDNPANFTISAPIQPGNSGGPIIDRSGSVVGVAVAVADAIKIADQTGSIPQNLNLAIKVSVLTRFLSKHGAAYETGKMQIDLAEGVPASVQEAVVPILCHGQD